MRQWPPRPTLMPLLPRLLSLCLVLAACSDAPTPDVGTPIAPPPATLTAQLDWLLDLINRRHGVLDPDEPAQRFTRSYRAGRKQLHKDAELYAPLTYTHIEQFDAHHAVVDAESPVGRVRIVLELDPDDGRIDDLVIRPRSDASFPQLTHKLENLAPRAQYLAAELVDGTCQPIHALHEHRPFPLASVFKLYILLALVDRIDAGALRWDDLLAIRDDWKSLATGTLQAKPAGTSFRLHTHARYMIARSDNAATDHLLHTVGRQAVEAAMRDSGHHDTSRNTPMLSTGEVSNFWHLPPELVELYRARPEADRREFLDRFLAGHRATTLSREPAHIDTIGWFASAVDLCRLMATLSARTRNSPNAGQLIDVLASTRDHGLSPTRWPFMAYKPGGVPGVRAYVALLRRDDDREFVVVIAYSDPAHTIDGDEAYALAWRSFELLAEHDRQGSRSPPPQAPAP